MDHKLNKKVIWITGASSGIGKALCQQLAEAGAILILSSRDHQQLALVKNDAKNSSLHKIITLDLSDSASLINASQKLDDIDLRVDILINCAGVSQRGFCLETSEDVDRHIMEIDYFGTIKLTKLVAAKMIQSKGGTIVCIASLAGKLGSPNRGAYSAAKHAVIGFMDCLRAEVHSKNVRVLVINPGWIKTNISKNALMGDMTEFGRTDQEIESGMPVSECAEKVIAAILSNKEEVVIATGLPYLGYHGRRLFPNSFHKILRKVYNKNNHSDGEQ